jgi:hypothetical protein
MTAGKHRISSKRTRGLLIAGAVAATYAAGTVAAKRMGYSFGRNVVVKCRAGHVFSTIWIPGGSLKSLRLGLWRVQWCPVGKHIALIHPVKAADLTDDVREAAAAGHDVPIP